MLTAFVLLDVDVHHMPETAEAISAIDGVIEVYSVTGRYDLIAKVSVSSDESLADLVTMEMGSVVGIQGSETLIAFRSYAVKVLDAGLDQRRERHA